MPDFFSPVRAVLARVQQHFGTRCSRCHRPILRHELAVRDLDAAGRLRTFHQACAPSMRGRTT